MISVLLDSNALRRIGGKRLGGILEAEARAGVLQLQDSWTLYELISHLVTPSDPDYVSSRRAIEAAARRSFLRPSPQILFPTESLVALMFFGENPPGLANSLGLLVECSEEIAQAAEGSSLDSLRSLIEEVATNHGRLETWFADHLRQLTTTLLEVTTHHLGKPDRATIRTFLRSSLRRLDAVALISRAHSQLGRTLPDPIPEPWIDVVGDKCAAGTAVMIEAFVRIICDGANLENSRTRNLVWDQEIAFPVGQQVGETEVHLVTDDKVFAHALEPIGMGRFVRSLDVYLGDIGVGGAV